MWITIIICSFDCWVLFLDSRSCDRTLNRSTCNQNKLVCGDILLCGFGHQAATQAIYILGYLRNKLTSIYSIIIVPVYQLTPNSIFPEHYTPLLTAVQFRILKLQNAHTLHIVPNWAGKKIYIYTATKSTSIYSGYLYLHLLAAAAERNGVWNAVRLLLLCAAGAVAAFLYPHPPHWTPPFLNLIQNHLQFL